MLIFMNILVVPKFFKPKFFRPKFFESKIFGSKIFLNVFSASILFVFRIVFPNLYAQVIHAQAL